MRPRRTEGRGGLNEVFNQPVTLEIWMEKAEKVLILTDPLKGLAHAKIIKKSVILFRVLNMTI